MNDQIKMGLTIFLAFLCSIVVNFVVTIMENSSETRSNSAKKAWQAEAVNVGHAKWIVDKKGNLKFKWLATQTAEVGEKND